MKGYDVSPENVKGLAYHSVTMETSCLVTVGLRDIHSGGVRMDSGSGNGQEAVPGEMATLTLMTSHSLQDVSWASSLPEHLAWGLA